MSVNPSDEAVMEKVARKNPTASGRVRWISYGDLNRDRTCDPYPVKVVLSQLSYQIK
jgi:hypothetical protein